MNAKTSTRKRKEDHINIAITNDVQYKKSAGFEEIMLVHNALPELDFNKIKLETKFLGKNLHAPIIIEAMTGGYPKSKKINLALAEAAEKAGIAFGLGSQRAMIENPSLAETYKVRKIAPTIPIIANIGACQLKKYSEKYSEKYSKRYFFEKIEKLILDVDANALAVHLNPLQEIIQPEGDKDFSGIVDAIKNTCEKLSVPVIVKETGAGIGSEIAKKLKEAGVKYIDIAGAGGTSWSAIEYERNGAVPGVPGFADWGIPTVVCIIANRGILSLIASGGLRSGIDAAKAIALGAEMAGAAWPFLRAYKEQRLENEIAIWKNQLKACMFLTGSANIASLKKTKVFISSSLSKMAKII
ncbi:MAG: type 2 isopentenyl-diphosphate Delta-isomerase [Candidatus Micrarchaeota archaeon]